MKLTTRNRRIILTLLFFFLASIALLRFFVEIKNVTSSDGNLVCSREPNMTQINAIIRDLELKGCDPTKVVNLGSQSENRFAQGFMSQHGQDQWVQTSIFQRLPPILHGYFIEFGARDGIEHSNTYFFEKQGWDGLLIEPTEADFNKLLINRPRSTALHGALCDKAGKRNFWLVSWPGWSGLEDNLRKSGAAAEIDRMVAEGTWSKEVFPMQCYFLADYVRKRKHIHILSADCEGCEAEVFSTFPWNDVIIDVVIRERQCANIAKERETILFMANHGFKLVNWQSSDLIYLRNQLACELGFGGCHCH